MGAGGRGGVRLVLQFASGGIRCKKALHFLKAQALRTEF